MAIIATCNVRSAFGQAFVRFRTRVGGKKAGRRVREALTSFPFLCSPVGNRAPTQVSMPTQRRRERVLSNSISHELRPRVAHIQAQTAFVSTRARLCLRVENMGRKGGGQDVLWLVTCLWLPPTISSTNQRTQIPIVGDGYTYRVYWFKTGWHNSGLL